MSKRSFSSEFQIDLKKHETVENKNNYDIFENKDLLDELRNRIIQNIIDNNVPSNMNFNDYINYEIDASLSGIDLSTVERNYVFNLIDNEINGIGPVTELLKDKNVSEIMINGPNEIYVEIDGQIIKDETVSFINDEHITRTIQKIVQPLGRTIDASSPMVDARLKDGSRINAILPPLSLRGPILTIRKFKEDLNNIEDLLRNGTMTNNMALFLDACVKAKLNILVCGGTGSGKTTILNILSSFIGEHERVITIEDAAELKLKQRHVISLETRIENYDSKTEVSVRDLVRNSLRMRPDRIIVGEVRGGEAFDMLQAMNTGHDGSLTTMHANGSSDALNRLETMVLMGGIEIPVPAIRDYITNAIDVIINITRLSDGRRKVTSISEVIGIKDNEIEISEIFAFVQKGIDANGMVDGEFLVCKKKVKVYSQIKSHGIDTLNHLFGDQNE